MESRGNYTRNVLKVASRQAEESGHGEQRNRALFFLFVVLHSAFVILPCASLTICFYRTQKVRAFPTYEGCNCPPVWKSRTLKGAHVRSPNVILSDSFSSNTSAPTGSISENSENVNSEIKRHKNFSFMHPMQKTLSWAKNTAIKVR